MSIDTPGEHDHISTALIPGLDVESRFADTPRFRFHYVRTGTGSPVVLIPGGGEWLCSYRELIPALAHRHTVYAFDPPGHGYTEVLDPGFACTTDAMADAVGVFLDAVGLPQAALVGHSWGGGWALRFAESHPERVTRLALIGPTGLDVKDTWDWRILEYPLIGELATRFLREADVARMLRKSFAHPDRVTTEKVRRTWDAARRPANRRLILRLQRRVRWADTERELSRIHAPVLLIWGAEDRYLPATLAGRFTRRLPQATVRILPGCGHSAHEDCPAQVNPALEEFIGEDPTAT
ncbi:alpha/beta fold hydrolase [Actinoallomurus purpureus]|uniref:alpha/beta fold hydrolase n=1 Tax=Actinoallomurus purpureus TaxID=478114 RepID=UPI002093C8E2|nr:alpha/beta fold hydrolase [Actinoallomurus purpureus]MCO6006143.1 alpha/beta fold hydrolase [Actinoallomurus purpureus]